MAKIEIEGVELELDGYGPVQAYGTVDGLPAYFRARHQEWSFGVAAAPGLDAVDVGPPNVPGWYFEGSYGRRSDASWMDYDDAARIVRACIEVLRAQRGDALPSGSVTLRVTNVPTGPGPE